MIFKLKSGYTPAGDQPQAIDELVDGINRDARHQVLLGVTGSGKTFTMANVIERTQLPTLIISHNKTLAAQLFQEFKEFFPDNAVEYFVSFYDYYQPEAYLPSTDTYIAKTSMINDEIDRLRLKATSSLLSRRDVVIVASVSCIYGIGSPEAYEGAAVKLRVGQEFTRRGFLTALSDMQYVRNDMSLHRGAFRVKGDVIEVQPAYEEDAVRIETFGDKLEAISYISPLTGKTKQKFDEVTIFPAKHYMTVGGITMKDAVAQIEGELNERLSVLRKEGKLVEAQRLEQRTRYDMEMLTEVGYVNGIENYSRILDGREPGSRPYTLIDFFKPPYLLDHRRVARVSAADTGDVQRRPRPQRDARRPRFPPPVRPRQPPAEVQRVRGALRQDTLRLRDAGRLRAGEERRRHRGAGDPPHALGRSADRAAPGRQPGGRSDRPAADNDGARRAGVGHHADEEDGRRPDRVPRLHRAAGALPALRDRHWSAPRYSKTSARGSSTY